MKIDGGQEKYEIIDYLKGFSIITIVLMHIIQSNPSSPFLHQMASLGGSGIHIFFFCSGFGLCLSQQKKNLTFWMFLKKRFMKIYLPYIVIVTIICLMPFSFEGTLQERLMAYASHVFLFKMFVPALDSTFSYAFWYMSTLFQFYFAFMGLFWLKNKMGRKKFFLLCFIISGLWSVITLVLGISDTRVWGSFFLQYLWEFALGMCLAERLHKGESIHLKPLCLALVMIAGLVIGGILGIRGGVFKAFNDVFLALGYGAFAILIFIYLKFYKKLCILFSSFSYELYLIHTTVILGVTHYCGGCSGIVRMIGAFIISIALAVAIKFIRCSCKREKKVF